MCSSAGEWILYGADEDYYLLGATTRRAVWRMSDVANDAYLIVCGLGLYLLARNERRYPDESREVRAIVLAAGSLIIALALIQIFVSPMMWIGLPSWGRYILSRLIYGPWASLVIGVIASTYALGLAKRGNSRALSRVSQLPAWPIAGGLIIWLLSLDRLIWPLYSLIWNGLLPLSVIAVLTPTIRLLLRGAREAEANWSTDL